MASVAVPTKGSHYTWQPVLLVVVLWVLLVAGLSALASHEEGHGKHKDPDALEHVMDATDWHLFDTFGPHPHLPWPITKFMLLELLACGLILAIYVPLARRIQSGEPPRGAWDNTFEVLLTFIRDEVAKPGIGEHDADRHVPFLWTMFLFVLFNNLLGIMPFGGSATASIYV